MAYLMSNNRPLFEIVEMSESATQSSDLHIVRV